MNEDELNTYCISVCARRVHPIIGARLSLVLLSNLWISEPRRVYEHLRLFPCSVTRFFFSLGLFTASCMMT